MSQTVTGEKKKKTGIAVAVLCAAAVLLGVVYFVFAPKAVTGEKAVVIEVVDDKQETDVYRINTDAEYLRGAMEDAGIEFSGTEGEYGLMVETVNGLYADYVEDKAYWAFYVGEEYCNYGVDLQPVEDGKTYRIVYTVME